MLPSRVEADADSIERTMKLNNSGATPMFPTPRDVIVSHVLAFLPKAVCCINNVRIVERKTCKFCYEYIVGDCRVCGGTEYPF